MLDNFDAACLWVGLLFPHRNGLMELGAGPNRDSFLDNEKDQTGREKPNAYVVVVLRTVSYHRRSYPANGLSGLFDCLF